jgi:hypothetical protein
MARHANTEVDPRLVRRLRELEVFVRQNPRRSRNYRKFEILQAPISVALEARIGAIERFNKEGTNPYGPHVPVRSHSPLLFLMEYPPCLDVEVPFYPHDRSAQDAAFMAGNPGFHTRHALIFPMTRALIARQWHRVYAFDVRQHGFIDVKLLVGRKLDPELFEKDPTASAWPWVRAAKRADEPVASD